MQIVADFATKPFSELRILDLASLEGHYSIELALRGSKVLGVEGRRTNLEKANAEKERLGLSDLEFVRDDVRNLSLEKYGEFDVVLCLGILYHLDVPDTFELMEHVSEVCRSFAVIDTHISIEPNETVEYKGVKYAGWVFQEYDHEPSAEELENSPWAALGNLKSFWLTRPSLYNALSDAGFTSVYECHNPSMTDHPDDRITLVATKNARENLLVEPLDNSVLNERWPERTELTLSPAQQLYYDSRRRNGTSSSRLGNLFGKLFSG